MAYMAKDEQGADVEDVPQSGLRSKVRYAVVGAGHIAQVAVLPAFANAENAELVALVSDDPVKRKDLGKRYEIDRCVGYDAYDELLGSGSVDAVYIALPNHLHCEYSVRAAQAGVHVLCEKPMAVTEAECERMMEAAATHGVELMVAYRLHFEEANLEAIDLVERGEIGEPRIFSSVFTQDVREGDIRLMPLDQGGGSVYDMGVYCINAARYLFQDEPYEVFAVSASKPDKRFSQSDEMTSAILRFRDDRLATFTTSFGAVDVSEYRIVGTEGTLHMEPAYDYAVELAYEVEVEGHRRHHKFKKRDQFGPELVYFADCVISARPPEPDGAEGLADVRIVRAIYESAASGKPVKIERVPQRERPSLRQRMKRPGVQKPREVHAAGPKR